MTRTQISMDREMLGQARARASDQGVSLAEYVRQLVAADLGRDTAPTDVSAIFDMFDSGGSNIARDKDQMIADAIAKVRGI